MVCKKNRKEKKKKRVPTTATHIQLQFLLSHIKVKILYYLPREAGNKMPYENHYKNKCRFLLLDIVTLILFFFYSSCLSIYYVVYTGSLFSFFFFDFNVVLDFFRFALFCFCICVVFNL